MMAAQAGEIQNAVSLAPYNSLAIPAVAQYLVRVESEQQLRSALDYATRQDLPFCVLGEGSNVVFSADYAGLVILLRTRGIELIEETETQVYLRVAAGEAWHDLVRHCISQQWYGLENLALIPGLVGAAPIQNIGAYGVEVKDFIDSVKVLEIKTAELKTLSDKDCEFSYRDSVFKHRLRDQVVITEVVFALRKQAKVNLSYQALASELSDSPSPKQVFEAVCRIRSSKLPDPAIIPNAGSFFKNPVVDAATLERLKKAYPEIVFFPFNNQFKLAAAWLIDQRGWKHKAHQQVRVHQHQALVITNPAKQQGSAVLALAQAIQKDIKENFGVDLEIEPRVI